MNNNKRYTIEIDGGRHIQQLVGEYSTNDNINYYGKTPGSVKLINLHHTHYRIFAIREVKDNNEQ